MRYRVFNMHRVGDHEECHCDPREHIVGNVVLAGVGGLRPSARYTGTLEEAEKVVRGLSEMFPCCVYWIVEDE